MSLNDWTQRTQPLTQPLLMYKARTEINSFNATNGDVSGFCTVRLASDDPRQVESAKTQLEDLQRQKKLPIGLEIFEDPGDAGHMIYVGFKSDLSVPKTQWADHQQVLAADALRKAAMGFDIPFTPAKEEQLTSCDMTSLWRQLEEVIRTHLPHVQIKGPRGAACRT